MQADLLTWLQYTLLGYAAMLLHVILKVSEANKKPETVTTFAKWVKTNKLELISGVVAYHIILFLWAKEGISFFGMLQGQPSGLTAVVAYTGNSFAKSLFSSMAKKANVGTEENKPIP